MKSEDKLIERIARLVPSQVGIGRGKRDVGLGIGDDAAILKSRRGLEWVVSCDNFVEGVHFLADVHPADSVGYKALARATSDLAAMGARPRFFLLALALPAQETGRWLDEFLRGMGRAARQLGLRLIGGDTTTSRTVAACLTVFGEVEAGRAVRRAGASAGHRIYVSGRLGRAHLGLKLLRAGFGERGGRVGDALSLSRKTRNISRLLEPHLYPQIRVELGMWLARNRIPSAMMDLSDGLSTDLQRLCEASGVGAKIWAERIPRVRIREGISRFIAPTQLDPLQMALHGGDDYELLFTVPQKKEGKLLNPSASATNAGLSGLTYIGEVVRLTPKRRRDGGRVVLVDEEGRASPLEPGGWDPFRR